MRFHTLIRWFAARDRGFAALRRAARTAIVMPAMFALGDKVIGNPDVATFAAFGSFAMLLLVDFGGPMRDRLQAQAALALVGARVRLRRHAGLAQRLARGGRRWRSSASACSSPASSARCSRRDDRRCCSRSSCRCRCAGPASSIPDRLAGWGMASVASLRGDRGAVAGAGARSAASAGRGRLPGAGRAAARRGRATRSAIAMRRPRPSIEQAIAEADAAVAALHRGFLATPYRPTGLSTPARTVVRLVDELNWLNAIVAGQAAAGHGRARPRDLRGEGGRGGGARTRSRPARRRRAQRLRRSALGRRRATRVARHDGAQRDRAAAGRAGRADELGDDGAGRASSSPRSTRASARRS